MFPRGGVAGDGLDGGREVDMVPEGKVGGIVVEVLDVALGGEEVGFRWVREAEVGKQGELLGGHELMCQGMLVCCEGDDEGWGGE